MRESNLYSLLKLRASEFGIALFRNNVGLFETASGQKIRTGLCVGSSDLIGWMPIEITQEMVGKRLAIFTALELKSSRGKKSEEQTNFINAVKLAGGMSGVVKQEDDLNKIRESFIFHSKLPYQSLNSPMKTKPICEQKKECQMK